MSLISFIIVLVLTVFCLWRLSWGIRLSQRDLYWGWGIKLAYAFLFVFIFSQYYGNGKLYGDAYNFMNDSKVLYEYGKKDPGGYFKLLFGFAEDNSTFNQSILGETQIWSYGDNGDFINDNRLIIRINSVIHFFSFGNVYVHALLLAFLSYLGVVLLYKTFYSHFSNKRLSFFVLIAFPSIGFWGSGITKEALLLFGMGLFFYGLFKSLTKAKPLHFILLLAGVFILLFNKPHVGLILIALSPFLIYALKFEPRKIVRTLFPFICITGLVVLTYTPTQFNLLDKVSYKQKDLINIGKGGIFFVTDSSFCAFDFQYLQHFKQENENMISVLRETKGEYKLFGENTFAPFSISPSDKKYDVYLIQPPSASYIEVEPINYSGRNMLTNIPEAMVNTLIRPAPEDPGSVLKYFSFANNLLFLGMILFTVFYRKNLKERQKLIITYFVISGILILLLIGWTTPILGAIVRYKIAAELLLLFALSMTLKPLKK